MDKASEKIQYNSGNNNWFVNDRMLIISYLLVTATAAIFMFLEVTLANGALSRDGSGYLLYTHEALQHGWAAAAAAYPQLANYPPLLMILMYHAGKLGMDLEFAGRALNLCGIMFTAWGALYCCRKLYKDQLTALCSALMLISIPKIYLEGCDIMRDPLYWAFSIWSLAIILKLSKDVDMPERKYFGNFIGLSLLLAAASLTRKEGIFLTLLVVIWNLVFNSVSWQKKLYGIVLIIAISAAALLLPLLLGVPWNILEIFSELTGEDV